MARPRRQARLQLPFRCRSFAKSDRHLVPADGFYEFPAPDEPGQKHKTKWCFTLAGEPWFRIAAIVRDGCFTMLTTPPGSPGLALGVNPTALWRVVSAAPAAEGFDQ
jgi:putative SOS response-associated peptidase YedK